MLRKVLAVLLSVLMLTMGMAVYATEAEHVHEGCCGDVVEVAIVPENGIVPMAELCSNCGTGTIIQVIESVSTEQRAMSCIHGYTNRTDVWEYTTTKYHYDCSTSWCDQRSSTTTTTTRELLYCIVNS